MEISGVMKDSEGQGGQRVEESRDSLGRGQRGQDGNPLSTEQEWGSEPSGQSPYLQVGKLRLREVSQ